MVVTTGVGPSLCCAAAHCVFPPRLALSALHCPPLLSTTTPSEWTSAHSADGLGVAWDVE